MKSDFDMKVVREPLFPQRRVAQTLFGRSAITGIMMMDQALLPSVTPTQPSVPSKPPVMQPGEPVTTLPTQPVTPTEPTEPVEPVEPEQPPVVEPEQPPVTQPEQPTTPVTPPVAEPTTPPVTEPATPAQPTEPTTPTTPTQPTTPTEPEPQPTPAPTITTQPQAVRVVQGASFSLTVAASDANTYKWQRLINGTWTDISGARSKTYTVTSATTADSGDYRAIAAGTGGQTASSSATVKVDTAFIAIGKQTLLGVDIVSLPFTKVSNGQQTFALTLKAGPVTVSVGKFGTGVLGTLLGSVLTPLTGGISTLRWVIDDPAVISVSTTVLGQLTIKPLNVGKTYLRLYADAAGLTADGFGVIEITVT